MNPLTNVKNIIKLNETELAKGYKKSWHDMYSNSAWIFIGGLSYGLTEGDILAVFSQYGEIININLVRDKKTGKTKGYCFLCYANQKSTILAVDNLNGIKLCNRTIRVDHVANYKPPKENETDDDITKMLKSEGCAPKVMQASEKQKDSKSERKKKKKLKKEKKESKKKKRKHHAEELTEVKVKKEKQDPGYDKNDFSNTKRTSESRFRERNREGESSNFRYDDYRPDDEKHSKSRVKGKERSQSRDAAGYQDRVKDNKRSEQNKQYSSSSDDNSSSSSSSDEEKSNYRQSRHYLKDQKSSDERSKWKKSKYED